MMRDRSPSFSLQPALPQHTQGEPRHWSLQAPGILRTTPKPKPSTAIPTAMPSIAAPNLNTPAPRGPSSHVAASSKHRSKAISLPASPSLSSTDLNLLAYDPIPLFSLDAHCSSPTHHSPSMDLDAANDIDDAEDEDDPMDTADDVECAFRIRTRSHAAPFPHVRSASDSHHHVLLGPRVLKRAKSIGKGIAPGGGGDAHKISSYFRTLKRTGAAHGPGLFPKSLSDPTLVPAMPAAAPVVGRSFKRAGTPAMGGGKGHGGGAPVSSYFTKPGAFKAKPGALAFANTRTGQQQAASPRRGTIGSSYVAKSILADAFERMSISPTAPPRSLQPPQVGAGMGFVDGGMATVQFESQQTPGGFAASAAATEFGYAPGFPGRRG